MLNHSSFAPWRLCAQNFVGKRSLIASLFLLLVTCTPTAAQKKVAFDPDGSFWVHGTPPTEFSELSAINLNAKRLRRLPSPGLQINDGSTYRFKTLNVKRNAFTFTTVERKNISYSFSGKFLKGGNYAATALNDEVPVMEGTLTRYESGKKVAEARIRFIYFGGT
jgi:hypothetical protein